jgi:hypothetical protein
MTAQNLILALLAGGVAWLAWDGHRRRSGASLVYLAGMALVYAGERLFGDDTALHMPLTGLGVAVAIASLVLRFRATANSTGERAAAHRQALAFASAGVASLGLYALSTPAAASTFGWNEEMSAWAYVVFNAMWPVPWLIGTFGAFWIDQVMTLHPVQLPARARQSAAMAGTSAALAIALVFPVNYLAQKHPFEWDFSYFRVAQPGSSTLALARDLSSTAQVYMFFSPANEVRAEILPYFQEIERSSGGKVTLTLADQPVEPELSKELEIKDNGYIAIKLGEGIERFKVGTDLAKARRDLKKLDETFQKHLLKLAKGKRTAYLLTGHGEANARDAENPLYKLSLVKKVLTSQNYQVKDLGIDDGSADRIPDDAAFVLIAGPEKDLLPEEEAALKDYLGRKGALFVLADPGRSKMTGLLEHLGVKVGDLPLVHSTQYLRSTRGVSDRGNLFTNRFGTHTSVSTLSKYSTQLSVIFPSVVSVTKVEGTQNKITTLFRSMASTFEDKNGDFEQQQDEAPAVFDLGVAITGADEKDSFRAIVVGDVSLLSDPVLQFSQGTGVFVQDALRWLVGDEEIIGETNNEEDVKIEHTRDDDIVWFYGTIFAVPALIMIAGGVFLRLRRRAS